MSLDSLLFIAALVSGAVLLYKLWNVGRRVKDYPLGPATLPVVGNALDFPNKRAHFRLTEWSRFYGDIYSLMIGPGVIVVISSYTAVKELLDKQANITGDRPQTTIGDTVTGGVHMAQAHYHDPNWTLLRRAARSIMTVQKCAEHLPIQRAESIQFMYDVMKNPQRFDGHAQRYTYSVISSVVYGCRFPRIESKEVADFYHVTALWSRLMEPGRHPPIDLIPILKKVPEPWAKWKTEAREVRRLQRAHYFGMLDKVQKRLDRGESCGTFMENIIQNQKSLGMDQELMAYLGGVLLEGGSDTTSSYLKSLHLALTAHPDAQRKAHEEMDRVVGQDRLPKLDDMAKLPYVRAIIRETQRWRPAAPLSLPHAATEDAYYRGYTVPKGATILLNVWAIAHDETIYERPDDFWPDRYILSEFGTKPGVDTSDFRHTLPYGSGKRICPGIHLAANSVEFNTMMLIWAFDFVKALDTVSKRPIEIDTSNYSEGLFTSPNRFPYDIKPRSAHHAALIEHALRDATPVYERFETELTPEDARYAAAIRGAVNNV